ncbi:hypothetical protein HK104_011086 [Borealophlyctis nickersoniae]|nr:hypothetical protein HK104_011086 [Borealophlyctis nickersoniae]
MGDILGDTVDPYALGDESQFDPYGGAYLDDSSYLNQTLEGETDHQTSAGEPQEQEQQQQQQQQQQEEEQQHQQQQQQQQRHQMDEGGSSTNYAFDRNPSNILDPNRPEAG